MFLAFLIKAIIILHTTPEMDTFVGVDAGGTTTYAVLVDAQGHVLRDAHGGPANPHVHGMNVSLCTLTSVLSNLLGDCKNHSTSHTDNAYESLVSIVVALSGADQADVAAVYTSRLRDMLLLPMRVKLFVFHDSVAPAGLLLAGISGAGDVSPTKKLTRARVCVLIAGTGSVASVYEIRDKLQENDMELQNEKKLESGARILVACSRAGGRGPIVGDDGSAYAIATNAVKRALRVHDRVDQDADDPSVRMAAREVLALAADTLNVKSNVSVATEVGIASLVAAIHAPDTTRGKLASLAEKLSDAANCGNCIAIDAFSLAAKDLAVLVSAVLDDTTGTPIIATGGVFASWDVLPDFRDIFLRTLSQNSSIDGNLWLSKTSSPFSAAVGAARIGALILGGDKVDWENRNIEMLRCITLTTENHVEEVTLDRLSKSV